ncbi:fibrous sheath CABYR-binding protein-like [Cyprinodon tularosa]|uniref:fibrous sheath CABYR-binding protein-like n=1 Tax=Cyprinodon tularosa TaxID=77115 RepID=UPI0018E1DE44|nr:fibrous sheath CABYR-binding protein-like [Cyprinodon tularosa]
MGCSSSSAQTVEQEKRPGTKPEETKGDTVAVKNGIITEDVQTIADQMQLPAQTPLPDDLISGPEDGTEAVLMAMEAQEDLGSGEDLLEAPDPQPEPASSEEPAPQPASSAAVEDSAEPEVASPVVEVEHTEEETLPVESLPAEAPLEIKAPEATEETPDAKSVEAVQTEVLVSAEEVSDAAVEEPSDTPQDVEKAEAEESSKILTEGVELVNDEAPNFNTTAETASEDTGTEEASTPTPVSALAEPSGPADTPEPLIDTALAAASIPEMTPLTPTTALAPAEHNSVTEEETQVASLAEVPGPAEVTAAPNPAQTPEAPPETGVTAEVPVVNPITTKSEAASDPEPAAEPVPEPPPEETSITEASKETEAEITKKQD